MHHNDIGTLYQIDADLRAILEDMLRMVLQKTATGTGSIHLRGSDGVDTLRAEYRDNRVFSHWTNVGELPFDVVAETGMARGAGPAGRRGVTVPVKLAGTIIGRVSLSVTAQDRLAWTEALAQVLAQQCTYLMQRHLARGWSRERLNQHWMLAGMSQGMRLLDAFVERAAASSLPVLLHGEFGTEIPLVAAAIHACAARRDGPFLHIQCTAGEAAGPESWLNAAVGGTVLLVDIEHLPMAAQDRLAQYLALPAMAKAAENGAPAPARLIAASAADLRQMVRDGQFSRPLLARLDYLTATIPPLRDRREDMRALLAAALERHGQKPEERLSDELVTLCQAHDWPDNWLELDRFGGRLAVMAAGRVISHADIVRHAAWILPADRQTSRQQAATTEAAPPTPPPANAPPNAGNAGGAVVPLAPPPAQTPPDHRSFPPDHWVAMAINPDPTLLKTLHPCLRRALAFLGRSYAEPVSLHQLASQSHVSASHLSFLFRTELGLSTKTLLNRIRIHKAQEILRSHPRLPVTEVALQVGFADLSHFEKSFRRFVNRTPGQYRRGG
ncbi:AraC family transcriptional regulator [Niveispirillum irakense]|uniref:AraC family transcriptional regulator n=1 Tax=Niveispirillum irakense TaxID=34011 RepID=UPI0013782297|nr:AraC family transcriptional regulator [Niveispirillum irakense]